MIAAESTLIGWVAACVFCAAVAGMIAVGVWLARRVDDRRVARMIEGRGDPWRR